MLDKRCFALLDIINTRCKDSGCSGYKVFSFKELKDAMPTKLLLDENGVVECLFALEERDYISVKYQDKEEICLCPLTKGRLVFENRIDEFLEKLRVQKKCFLFSFFGSLVGAILGFLLLVAVACVFRGIG